MLTSSHLSCVAASSLAPTGSSSLEPEAASRLALRRRLKARACEKRRLDIATLLSTVSRSVPSGLERLLRTASWSVTPPRG